MYWKHSEFSNEVRKRDFSVCTFNNNNKSNLKNFLIKVFSIDVLPFYFKNCFKSIYSIVFNIIGLISLIILRFDFIYLLNSNIHLIILLLSILYLICLIIYVTTKILFNLTMMKKLWIESAQENKISYQQLANLLDIYSIGHVTESHILNVWYSVMTDKIMSNLNLEKNENKDLKLISNSSKGKSTSNSNSLIKKREFSTLINNNSFPPINKELHEIIIGLILGDLHLRKRYSTSNTTLNFKGSQKHESYIRHLYSLFSLYCKSEPKIRQAKLGNKIHYSITFDTLTNKDFNYYHDLFYKNKIKYIPKNIGDLITARSLAYWAQDDGTSDRSGFVLHTNNYSEKEVKLLIKVLKENFNLDCSIHIRKETLKTKKCYTIYIKSKSYNTFIDLVSPYFHLSMKYKLKKRGSYKKS